MTFPAITAFYAALIGLLYVALSAWVIAGRVSTNVLHGDGQDASLLKRIRSHGNFAEYVPLTLLLIALLESGGASQGLVRTLLIVLLVARVLHPFGMFAPPNALTQFAFRGGGIIATLLVTLVAAVALLIRLA